MPFIPHTEDDVEQMLSAVGANNIDQLFDEIPADLLKADIQAVPTQLNEADITRLMMARRPVTDTLCFIGAGSYDHHVPAAVWEIATRGEYYTAYTPYQAEASQGSLQLIYEFQTMMAELMALEVANASLYDGATAVAEAALMAVRARRGKHRRILVPKTVNPAYRKVLDTILSQQGITVEVLPYDIKKGVVDPSTLPSIKIDDAAALIIPQPNFFGCLEEVDALTNWAHANALLVIGVVNPMAMALLKPPGQWGDAGADIACGEGQPLGVPMASGGPYFGFMCCKKALVRQLPGRIVGRTVDTEGRPGFTLTLQAREQHIRRSKATSNICTNQGLVVVAATIYMSLLGPNGLREVALASHAKMRELASRLSALPSVSAAFSSPVFHESVLRLDTQSAADVLRVMADQHIQAGYNLTADYPELGECILVCVTETKAEDDLTRYESEFARALMGDYNKKSSSGVDAKQSSIKR